MERISAAISKARQAREQRGPSAADASSSQASGTQSPVAPAAAAVDNWERLMEFRPNAQHLERNRIVSLAADPAAAPFDSLRTRLLYLMREKGWRRLAVTSPGPGCGKTTVCVNLALSLARLADLRTVVIDADFRRPAIAKGIGASAGHQIAEVLAGTAKAQDNLLRIGPNLALGTNRTHARLSAELLQSPQAAAALDQIEQDFQPAVMLFDLPPMLVSDDAVAALRLVDCAIIVAASETTTIAEIDRCERELAEHCNVVGVVLNKCRYLEKGEGYGYGYDYN